MLVHIVYGRFTWSKFALAFGPRGPHYLAQELDNVEQLLLRRVGKVHDCRFTWTKVSAGPASLQ